MKGRLIMKIGMIGIGLMGMALSTVWAQKGHKLYLSYSRSSSKLKNLASSIGFDAEAASVKEAIEKSDVIFLAINWRNLDDVLKQTGSLKDKIILTCILPMDNSNEELIIGLNNSGAEVLAEKTGAHVVECFNTVWSNAITIQKSETMKDMFYAGEDKKSKEIASQLIQDAGFKPIDVGDLSNARVLEPYGFLIGRLGFKYSPLVTYHFSHIS